MSFNAVSSERNKGTKHYTPNNEMVLKTDGCHTQDAATNWLPTSTKVGDFRINFNRYAKHDESRIFRI